MKNRIAVGLALAAVLGACRRTGTDANDSQGISALSANNSAYRGGAAGKTVGNAVTNSGTGVTGGNGSATVSRVAGNGARKIGGNPGNSAPAPVPPGTR